MKDIIKIALLTLVLTTVSTIIIISFGKTYTTKFYFNKEGNYSLELDDVDGKIEILEEKKEKNEYTLKLKAVKTGKVYLYVNNGYSQEGRTLYIHKNMVITDNSFFGKSTYSEIIPVSISIILIYILYLLIKRYKEHMKENLYQYKNITYFGIIIFISFFALRNFLSIFNYQGIYNTISEMIGSMLFVSLVMFPIALITFILVTISNIRLIIKEGMSLKNLLGVFLGIFLCLSTLLPDFTYSIIMKSQKIDIYNLNGPGPYIYNFIEALVYLTIAYLECVLLGTIVIAIKSVRKKLNFNKDYIIILGCQIRKDGSLTPLLKGRVDKALEFRSNQLREAKKDLVFITSGGKGTDEPISEGEAMKNYLLKCGIEKSNILVDDKSKNTYENFKFSTKFIKKKANVAFSTTNYHVLRAGLIATEQGLKVEGMGSKTKTYFWVNAFIREFIGTLYAEKKKHIIVFLLVTIIISIMIGITYIANNI